MPDFGPRWTPSVRQPGWRIEILAALVPMGMWEGEHSPASDPAREAGEAKLLNAKRRFPLQAVLIACMQLHQVPSVGSRRCSSSLSDLTVWRNFQIIKCHILENNFNSKPRPVRDP
jgi:hypothetical protein